jgi:hypothetical protein
MEWLLIYLAVCVIVGVCHQPDERKSRTEEAYRKEACRHYISERYDTCGVCGYVVDPKSRRCYRCNTPNG